MPPAGLPLPRDGWWARVIPPFTSHKLTVSRGERSDDKTHGADADSCEAVELRVVCWLAGRVDLADEAT